MTKNYTVNGYLLDEKQKKLIDCQENAIVIAGAGSGKTLTILGKVKYLLENNLATNEEILLLSFTNASTEDLQKKISTNIDILTFHKLAMNILKQSKIDFSICKLNTLNYIINEYLLTCKKDEQKNILKFLKITNTYKLFIKSNQFKSFCKFIETFINLYKTNNLNRKDIFAKHFTRLEKKILLIIFNIYQKYIEEKQSIQALDFDDMIMLSTQITPKITLKYKFIIIDEFQDTSLIRINLVKTIKNVTNAKIIVVGDDWQSIYRFSGCNLSLFLNFDKIFPNVTILKLTNTYRNSQELLSIATTFIQKNPLQITKDLHANNHNPTPIIFAPYKERIETFKKILNTIPQDTEIMVLSRNKIDINYYIDSNFTQNTNIYYYNNTKFTYYTVHKSKGLEADYVILLNCNNDILGFPNKIENNKIIQKLFPNKEIPYAEERRLFYVAITRCKKQLYILYDKYSPSIFVKEIKKIAKKQHLKIIYFR